MAHGKKAHDEIREKAFAMLAVGESYASVAKKLGLSESTVRTWAKKWENEDDPSESEKNFANFAELRAKKKEEFVNNAWGLISKAQVLLEKRLNRAIESETEVDKMIDVVLSDDELSDKTKQALISKLKTIKVDDMREIVTVLGTIYDKQALANKEATSIVEGGITVEFNIPRPPKENDANKG